MLCHSRDGGNPWFELLSPDDGSEGIERGPWIPDQVGDDKFGCAARISSCLCAFVPLCEMILLARRHEGTKRLTQSLQRSLQPLGLRRFFRMVGAGFFYSFGFGLFDKGGVGEAARERVTFLGGGFDGLGDARAFGV